MCSIKNKIYKSIICFDYLCVFLFVLYMFSENLFVFNLLINCAVTGVIQIILWINLELFT